MNGMNEAHQMKSLEKMRQKCDIWPFPAKSTLLPRQIPKKTHFSTSPYTFYWINGNIVFTSSIDQEDLKQCKN